jgi:hypothetical protein
MADKSNDKQEFAKPDSQQLRAFYVQKKRKKRKEAAE